MRSGIALVSWVIAVPLMSGMAWAQAAPPAEPLLAAEHPSVVAAAGAWDLALANGRQCRLQLNPKGTRPDLVVGIPPSCRLALPMLAQVRSWALAPDGRVLLRTVDGSVLARFGREGDGPLRARLGTEDATLAPQSGRYPDPARVAARTAATSPPRPSTTAVARPAPPPAESLPGIYAMMRDDGREICRIGLEADPSPAGRTTKAGQRKAGFAEPCPDKGLALFDPVGWRVADGRLYLVARKGHEVGLAFEAGGIWRKDPPSGATLLLRRTSP